MEGSEEIQTDITSSGSQKQIRKGYAREGMRARVTFQLEHGGVCVRTYHTQILQPKVTLTLALTSFKLE